MAHPLDTTFDSFQSSDSFDFSPANHRKALPAGYARALQTLALPAKTTKRNGTTAAQRTAARFVLFELMARQELTEEQEDVVSGAFQHAFEHDDVASSLYQKVKGTPLDFSAPLIVTPESRPRKVVATRTEERAKVEAKRSARRERDRTAYLSKGTGGGRSQGDAKGKKTKKK